MESSSVTKQCSCTRNFERDEQFNSLLCQLLHSVGQYYDLECSNHFGPGGGGGGAETATKETNICTGQALFTADNEDSSLWRVNKHANCQNKTIKL